MLKIPLIFSNYHACCSSAIYFNELFYFPGRGTDDAVDTFKRMISKSTLPPKEKKALIQYFLSTFFRHYSLYLFCMTKEREVNQGDISAKIEAPFLVDNLSKGIELDKWNFQQSLLKIEEEKEELRTVSGSLKLSNGRL